MKEGLSWFFRGDFNGPLRAKEWDDKFSSQANPATLDQSNLDIVVATLYAHPLLTLSLRDSIRRQIRLAQDFVRDHPNWVLAHHPESARIALAAGKHVLILALEGASGVLESEEDLKEFIDEGGIRIVTLLHLTDDDLGGVAFLHGIRALSSPIAFIKNIFAPHHDADGIPVNSKGLTERGREMARALIRRNVWIDLAHSSDEAQNELFPVLQDANLPLLYTHTVLRRYHGAERGISLEQIKRVARSKGFIGLMPSEEMLQGTPLKSSCGEGMAALATQFQEVAKEIGQASIGMGSDYNGGIPHLKPSCNTGTSLDQEGLWNIGQSQEVWKALRHLGAWNPKPQEPSSTSRFLEAWSRVDKNGST
jgi:microsomal dipeptidase-like Zn-dependent dipeptidase